MTKFAGREINDFTLEELARVVRENPRADTIERFSVHAEYGNTDYETLDVKREGALPDVTDEFGVMAYESLLLDAIRCVGTDYLELFASQGITVDAVALDVIGEVDLRGTLRPFGVISAAPAGWKSITFRGVVRTDAPKEKVARVHRVAWETNIAAASLNAPVRLEVEVEPLPKETASSSVDQWT